MVTHDELRTVLERYIRTYGEWTSDLEELDQLIASVPDATARTESRGHVTCSCIVVSPNRQVLMVRHKVLEKLLFPGGHIEPADASLLEAALRELVEETGLRADQVTSVIGGGGELPCPVDIDRHGIPANPKKREPPHQHFDFRFVFAAQTLFPTSYECDEVTELRALALNSLPERLVARLENILPRSKDDR